MHVITFRRFKEHIRKHPDSEKQLSVIKKGLKRKDLVGIIGDKTMVSKVMNRERNLNLRMIKNLHKKLRIPYKLLIQ